jgi:hypothetical protein
MASLRPKILTGRNARYRLLFAYHPLPLSESLIFASSNTTMGFFDNDSERQDQLDTVQNFNGSEEHKAKLTHEVMGKLSILIAGRVANIRVA